MHAKPPFGGDAVRTDIGGAEVPRGAENARCGVDEGGDKRPSILPPTLSGSPRPPTPIAPPERGVPFPLAGVLPPRCQLVL